LLKEKNFTSYFLIVWDFINWAREHGIPVGPGRGSAAGSLVAFCLGITDIDPLRFELVFERFLNPERVSPPDIDIDFCQTRRPRSSNTCAKNTATSAWCHIITFGTMGAKSSSAMSVACSAGAMATAMRSVEDDPQRAEHRPRRSR
jgi:DNA polymerase-3 subunit alpha